MEEKKNCREEKESHGDSIVGQQQQQGVSLFGDDISEEFSNPNNPVVCYTVSCNIGTPKFLRSVVPA